MGSSVIYVRSKAARGVLSMGFPPPPKIESGLVDDFKEAIDGSKSVKLKDQSYETTYSFAKLVATLWNGSMINYKFPNYHFISVSPGMTTGTEIMKDFPPLEKAIFSLLIPIVKVFGMSHSTDKEIHRCDV